MAGIQKLNVFEVPSGYFDTLAESILENQKNQQSSFAPSHQILFNDIPENYFTNLASEIIDKIRLSGNLTASEEISHLSPILAGIKKTDFFEVPAGYFVSLSDSIYKRVNSSSAPKVVVMKKRYPSMYKYAVAAVFAGFVAMSSFYYFNRPSQSIPPTLAVAVLDPTIEAGKKMKMEEFNENLNKLSGEEIAKYLEKNASEGDIAMLTATLDDEAGLSGKEDYLTNEKSLQSNLNEIITNN